MIPQWLKEAAGIALLIAAFVFGFWVRGLEATAAESRNAAKQSVAGASLVQHQGAVTAGVDASGAAREQKTQIVFETIHDQVTRYVEKKADGSGAAADCMLDAEWVRWHDAAAVGELPDASGPGHAAGAKIGGDR